MRLLIIRHGESEADVRKVHEGRADFELTGRGHRQAQAMAEFVKENYKVDVIYCSTLKRAYQTAEHLAKETGIGLIAEDRLREFNNGLLAGLSFEEADEKYPKQEHVPVHTSFYEQETALEFRFRADYMLSKILSENKTDATVAIVTHGGMILQLYRSFLKLPVDCGIVFATGDTGIHEWYIGEKERFILRSNMTGHADGIS